MFADVSRLDAQPRISLISGGSLCYARRASISCIRVDPVVDATVGEHNTGLPHPPHGGAASPCRCLPSGFRSPDPHPDPGSIRAPRGKQVAYALRRPSTHKRQHFKGNLGAAQVSGGHVMRHHFVLGFKSPVSAPERPSGGLIAAGRGAPAGRGGSEIESLTSLTLASPAAAREEKC